MEPLVDSLKVQLYFSCDCYSFRKLVDLWLFITTLDFLCDLPEKYLQ